MKLVTMIFCLCISLLYSGDTKAEFLFDGIQKQRLDDSCGPAVLSTILTDWLSIDSSEKNVLDYINEYHLKKGNKGSSDYELISYSHSIGLELVRYDVSPEQIFKNFNERPVIVHLPNTVPNHWSIYKGRANGKVFLADTNLGHIVMSEEEFKAKWVRVGEGKGTLLDFGKSYSNNLHSKLYISKKHTSSNMIPLNDHLHISKANEQYALLKKPNHIQYGLSSNSPKTFGKYSKIGKNITHNFNYGFSSNKSISASMSRYEYDDIEAKDYNISYRVKSEDIGERSSNIKGNYSNYHFTLGYDSLLDEYTYDIYRSFGSHYTSGKYSTGLGYSKLKGVYLDLNFGKTYKYFYISLSAGASSLSNGSRTKSTAINQSASYTYTNLETVDNADINYETTLLSSYKMNKYMSLELGINHQIRKNVDFPTSSNGTKETLFRQDSTYALGTFVFNTTGQFTFVFSYAKEISTKLEYLDISIGKKIYF